MGITVKTEKLIERNLCAVINSIAVSKLNKVKNADNAKGQPLFGIVKALGNSPKIIVSIA